jgi:hypothetical protein
MMIDACTVRWMTFATGCALTLTTALGGQSHAESLDASYTISFARIRVGDITATVVFGPNEYAMSANGRAGGLMKALMDGEGSFNHARHHYGWSSRADKFHLQDRFQRPKGRNNGLG